jgi:hypothetical protein
MKLEQLSVLKNIFVWPSLLFFSVWTSVLVVSANSPPVLSNATEAGILVVDVNEGVLEVVTLIASDDDEDIVVFSLYQDENETKDTEFFNLDTDSGVLSFVNAPSYDVPDYYDGNNVYTFTILYTDGNTSTIPVEVRVSVSPSNTTYSLLTTAQEGGVVSNGGEHRAGSQIILTATPLDGYVFFGWTGDVLVNANETSITLTMDRNKSLTGTFSRLNTPPSFTNALSVEFNENATIAAFSLTAIDADGDAMTFSISGSDGPFFSLNAATGLLEFVSQPDFENPSDYNSDNTYELQATVTDDQLNSDSIDMRIVILDDTTEPPTHFNLTVSVEGEGNVAVSGQYLASVNETFSYAVGSSLTLTPAASSPDYEFSKWTGDLNGSEIMKELTMASDKNVTAVFTKVNFAPSLTSPQSLINVDYHYENNAVVVQFLAEDLDGDEISFHLAESGDYLLFDLNASTGILTFKSVPDYENPSDIGSDNIYDLNVSVSDGQASSPLSPVQFTILDLPDDEWSLAEDKGVGWRYFSWFGNYYEANADWIYHEEHGWLYRSGETTASTWFYEPQLGWIWTSETAYPYFYSEDRVGWLYYKSGEGNARKFYDYFNESWLEVIEE